jgi:Domain of unknown function (DUF4440)
MPIRSEDHSRKEAMRNYLLYMLSVFVLTGLGLAEQPPTKKTADAAPTNATTSNVPSADAGLKAMFEGKVKTEWEALKKRDAKVYGELLDDDFEGVENDGLGERTKAQAVRELQATNVFDYTLWGFKIIPLGPDAAAVIYEVTMQFPPKSEVRFSRVYITELWVKRNGEWKEIHSQETHVK